MSEDADNRYREQLDRDQKLEMSYECEGKPRNVSMLSWIGQHAMDYAELYMSFLANSTDDAASCFRRFQVKTFGRELERAAKGILRAQIEILQGNPRYKNACPLFGDPAEQAKWERAVRACGGAPEKGEGSYELVQRVCREAGAELGEFPKPMPNNESVQI